MCGPLVETPRKRRLLATMTSPAIPRLRRTTPVLPRGHTAVDPCHVLLGQTAARFGQHHPDADVVPRDVDLDRAGNAPHVIAFPRHRTAGASGG
jgi:hypothetical protein